MTIETTPVRWYNRSMSPKATRLCVSVGSVTLLIFEGWLGRKRLIAFEAQYLLAFGTFVVGSAVLFYVLRKLAKDARKVKTRASFLKLQLWSGVLAGLAITLIEIFGDYTQFKLDTDSIVGSVFVGIIFGIVNSATLKSPAFAV